ncbi:unnamed protein product [Schistocephalus solidus]|uniref:Uncharacterized protein n=1 Tax=Schistocephalus solidus TaxID=70667 RepID=A0A183TJ05_SCHSO|nr:unnamed protein product [Schistocephalus solidus]
MHESHQRMHASSRCSDVRRTTPKSALCLRRLLTVANGEEEREEEVVRRRDGSQEAARTWVPSSRIPAVLLPHYLPSSLHSTPSPPL